MIHELKIEKEFFEAVVSRRKTFELRENADSHFKVGDLLALNEVRYGAPTGRSVLARVKYVLPWYQLTGIGGGLAENFVVMSIRPVSVEGRLILGNDMTETSGEDDA